MQPPIWDFFESSWDLVRGDGVVSVMAKIFSGGRGQKFLGKMRFFREGLNCFWSGCDTFGRGWDFLGRGWDYFRGVEIFQGNWKLFHGREGDIFSIINFFPGRRIKIFWVGSKFFRIWNFLMEGRGVVLEEFSRKLKKFPRV